MEIKEEDTSTRRTNSREALLDAAERLFPEKGYEAVSTRELAEAAGVNLGAIQYHFGSKAKLFVETVERMMRGNGCAREHFSLQSPPSTKEEAGAVLCNFIYSFLNYLLRPKGPQACRLMIREIFTEPSRDREMYEALVSTVVAEFSLPLEQTLVSALKLFLPGASPVELQRHAQSILGQCTVYVTHRPFVERLLAADVSSSPTLEETAEHIVRFTLCACGCSEDFIDRVLASARENPCQA